MVEAAQMLDLFTSVGLEAMESLRGVVERDTMTGTHPGQYGLDVVVDTLVTRRLVAAGCVVLSEESGVRGEGGITVVVDPVDGSTNAARRLWPYALSLCAVDAEGSWVAMVMELSAGSSFTAIRGAGAWRDGCAIQRSAPQMDRLIVGVNGQVASKQWWQTRSLGCASMELCMVAAGQLDGYVSGEDGHGVWDYLAAALVLQECDAVVVDVLGRPLLTFDVSQRRRLLAGANAEVAELLLSGQGRR